MKKKILILTQFGMIGGGSRVQVLQFVPFFEQAGFACVIRPMYSDSFWKIQMGMQKVSPLVKEANLFLNLARGFVKMIWHALTAWQFDAIILQKNVFPKTLFWLMTALNPCVIYEIEDTIFEPNPFLKTNFFRTILLRYRARLCGYVMKRSAWVVAENEYIASEVRKYNANVSLVTAPIDTKKYHPRMAPKSAGEPVVIGWTGSAATTYMLETVKPALARLGSMHQNVVLEVLGARSDFDAPGITLIKTEWSYEDDVANIQSFDIGLMPLEDNPFSRGWLGYKMIQYMAVGIPTVADDCGLNRSVIVNGENGFLVAGEDAWVEKLSLLIQDAPLRSRMGAQARLMAEKRFSLESNARVWVDVISRVCGMQ